MRKILLMTICCFLIALGTASASVMLTLETNTPVIDPCNNFDVDLVISGLNSEPFSVGDFDVDILFDTTQMNFVDYSLGTMLGDVALFEAQDWSLGDLGGGTVDLAELSLLDPVELDILQQNTAGAPGLDEFILATMTFHCLGPGISQIEIDVLDPLLFVGDSLATFGGFDVIVGNPLTITQTPEPGTILLFGMGLICFAASRKKT